MVDAVAPGGDFSSRAKPVFSAFSISPKCTQKMGQTRVLANVSAKQGLFILHQPQRGDLVCIWTGKELYLKRVIGLPGEEIALRDGLLYVNGHAFPELYLKTKGHWNVDAGQLGARHYVAAGDNRILAQSQAILAVVRQERIVGRLMSF